MLPCILNTIYHSYIFFLNQEQIKIYLIKEQIWFGRCHFAQGSLRVDVGIEPFDWESAVGYYPAAVPKYCFFPPRAISSLYWLCLVLRQCHFCFGLRGAFGWGGFCGPLYDSVSPRWPEIVEVAARHMLNQKYGPHVILDCTTTKTQHKHTKRHTYIS